MTTEPKLETSLMGKLIPPKLKIGKYEVSYSKLKWGVFFMCLVLGLVSLVAIIIYVELYIHSFDIRIDCNPDLPLNYERCLKRGCIWVHRTDDLQPPCFFPDGYGYRYNLVRKTSNGYHADLSRTPQKKIFGKEFDSVYLQVYFETQTRLRLKFADQSEKRYEVPLEVPQPPAVAPALMDYEIKFENAPQFGVVIKRVSTGTVIFNTNLPGMVFSDQFIQISTKLASSNIYGLGEHLTSEYRHSTNWKKWTFFARDSATDNNKNSYGVHPFYMNLEQEGNAHGVFLLNSNAMEVVLQPHPALTFRTIGGILDFYIFLGPTPEEVVQQYLEVIGFPAMPPYWGLGFQLSRWGYHTLNDVKTVSERTIENDIPYDVQHFDIDYMEDFRSFTYDPERYQDLPSFIDTLHKNDRKVVMILDPAISSNKTLKGDYPALDVGLSREVFITHNNEYLEGKCWPGKVYYPDFSYPETKYYWSQMFSEFRKFIKFDGIWIDMNEPSNFVDGSLNGCEKNSLNYPPYPVGVLGSEKDGKLFEKTICMDAKQHGRRHYDVHSLYGFFQANLTFRTLSIIIPGSRPMVLSRSTYSGSGRFTAHWLGDNFSTWAQMRASIPGILEFNLFGIPYVGADICGFEGNTTRDLCLRWMQLGAFYPFCRNHNSQNAVDQDPAVFGDDFIRSSREALLTRYELLPYLYTLFHLAHTQGSTVARPLLHEFAMDENTWNINDQFMWGPALLISPILYEGAQFVDAYFPEGRWYDFYSGKLVKGGKGTTLTFLDEGKINLHVRGGYILPLQKPKSTTEKSRQEPMGLFVAPDENGLAKGLLFWDDGVSYETQEHKKYYLAQIQYKQVGNRMTLSSNIVVDGYNEVNKIHIGYVTLCGQQTPSVIEVNGQKLTFKQWEYDKQTKVLRLESLIMSLADSFSIDITYEQ